MSQFNRDKINALRQSLRPLDLERSTLQNELISEYCRFFGIDFHTEFPAVTQSLGFLGESQQRIACQYFHLPESRATCFVVHGYFDHAGLYQHVIRYCLRNNYSVVAFDLPGHGLSDGVPTSIDDFSSYVRALNLCIDFFRSKLTGPVYAMAQSTGAAIVMDYLLTHPVSFFSKAVLMAPLVRPVKWKQTEWLHVFIHRWIKSVPRKFAKSSSDHTFLRFIEQEDPMQSKVIELDWVAALRRWIKRFLAYQPRADFIPLIVQGDEDETVDWRYNLEKISLKFPHAEVNMLDAAGHHLVNESDALRERLWRCVDAYLASDD